MSDSTKYTKLRDIANKLRVHSINSTDAAGSGHPTSCLSIAEIISVLFFNTMKYKVEIPRDISSDRFVLSKGHAAPILYAAWAEAGLFDKEELLQLRKITSDLEGHPTPRLSFVDVATGSLGQGLSCAVGMAYMGKYLDKADYRVFCLVGDGEAAEGAVWEAFAFGSEYKLDNCVAIIDANRLGQSAATSIGHDMDVYRARTESFGWNTIVVNGHSVEELCKALDEASNVKGKPTCIVAKTFKGQGVEAVVDKLNFHGKPFGKLSEEALSGIKAMITTNGQSNPKPLAPTCSVKPVDISNIKLSKPPNYTVGDMVAIRDAYGPALVKLGETNDRIIAIDGDMKNSTLSQKYEDVFQNRFIEGFIMEQNMVGVGIGCASRDRAVVFISTFASFLSRAFDQIRMGAISQTNVNFVGSHCGASIGPDGPSQMALEDLAMFQSVPGSTVFYPADATSCERAVELAANTKGICYVRSTRPTVKVIYKGDEQFQIGKCKVLRSSANDMITVVGGGVTVHEALKAADKLAAEGINIRVIDVFTVKPLDEQGLMENARQTGNLVLTVEDHYYWGGMGASICQVFGATDIAVRCMAVTDIPRSGQPIELLEKFGVGSSCIVTKVKEILKK